MGAWVAFHFSLSTIEFFRHYIVIVVNPRVKLQSDTPTPQEILEESNLNFQWIYQAHKLVQMNDWFACNHLKQEVSI